MVGRVTLVTLVTGLPASSSLLNVTVSGPGTGCKSGAAPGQIGIWCPVDDCQESASALLLQIATTTLRAKIKTFVSYPCTFGSPRSTYTVTGRRFCDESS